MISREPMVAHDTTKLSLAFAIAAFGMPAGATALTGVGWIDHRYQHARELRLVADKETQLAEGPIAVSRSLLWPANPRPRPNAAQIFEHNRPLRAFGFTQRVPDQPLADQVVRVFLKSTLATRKSFQASFGRAAPDFLECPTPLCVPLAAVLDSRTRERYAIAISGQIDDAQIDAQEAFSIARCGCLDFAPYKQIPLATNQRQISLSALGGKQLALAFATHERDSLSSI
jgi:hypothetical protein